MGEFWVFICQLITVMPNTKIVIYLAKLTITYLLRLMGAQSMSDRVFKVLWFSGPLIHWCSLIFCVIALAGCTSTTASSVPTVAKPLPAYFPPTAFSELSKYDANVPDRYALYLTSAGEPVLYPETDIKFGLRLSIWTSFNGYLTIRVVEHGDGRITANYKKYRPESVVTGPEVVVSDDMLIEEASFTVTAEHVSAFRDLIDRENFWETKTRGSAWKSDDGEVTIGADGSDWFLEVRSAEKYHVTYQWAPGEGIMRLIGNLMMKLAGTSIGRA